MALHVHYNRRVGDKIIKDTNVFFEGSLADWKSKVSALHIGVTFKTRLADIVAVNKRGANIGAVKELPNGEWRGIYSTQ